MKLICTILLATFLPILILAQGEWEILDSTNSPLQSNLIRVVESDSYGNIWLGTNHGLYKFDGSFWNNYTTDNSPIPNNHIDNFYLDRNNNIWFMVNASPYPYFVKFDGQNWETVDSNQTCFSDQSQLSRNFVVDSYGVKWINTFSNMIRYDGYNCILFDEQNVGILTTDCNKIDVDANDNFFFISQTYEAYHYGGIARTASSGWVHNYLVSEGKTLSFTINTSLDLVWVSTINFTAQHGKLVKMGYNLNVLNVYDIYNPSQQNWRYSGSLVTDLNGNIWQLYIDNTEIIGVLCFFADNEDWILFDTTNSPLPSDNIQEIAVDIYNDKLIATDKGLTIYNELGIHHKEQLTDKDTTDWGDVIVGNSVSKSLLLYNHTSEELIIDSLKFETNIFGTAFNIPITINAGDSCNILLTFCPNNVGFYHEKLILFTSSGMYPQILLGNGTSSTKIIPEINSFIFSLSNNYPNPFNPTTKIKYQLLEISQVKLTVFDILGREIKILVNEEKSAGIYVVNFDGSQMPSGVYFYRIEAIPYGNKTKKFSQTKELLLLK